MSSFPASREQAHSVTESLLRQASEASGDRRSELVHDAIVHGAAMARSLALRYDGRGVDRDDLFQVAYVGLVKAAHGYRPGAETDFRSYAVPTIRGELKRHFRDNAWAVRPPRRIQEVQAAINAVEGELAAQLHRWPTEQELADCIGVPLGDISDAQQARGCFRPDSLDAPIRTGSTAPLATLMADEEDTYELVNQVETLRPAVEHLCERDKLILHRRVIEHRSQAAIASEIGVSQMQVSRLLKRIMRILQTALVT